MMYDTGIDRKRLDVWLRNNRNRYVKVKRKQAQERQGLLMQKVEKERRKMGN